ncbi:MAG: hypothetical protein B6245_01030 [Desulfobacteraceae bacterium 4572_88]|nr:MAG: hypothetical protein B6245_01030 [Desulfobacteraceae bacterium 4572_88]
MERLSQIKLPAKLENLTAILQSVKDCAGEQGFAQKKLTEIELAIEEILVNIFNYAYEGEPGYARVTCGLDKYRQFIIEIEDAGIPFDPFSLDSPDLTDDIGERRIGGLGVFIVRNLMSDMQYRRESDKNIIRIKV